MYICTVRKRRNYENKFKSCNEIHTIILLIASYRSVTHADLYTYITSSSIIVQLMKTAG